jgi:hypothetical protein
MNRQLATVEYICCDKVDENMEYCITETKLIHQNSSAMLEIFLSNYKEIDKQFKLVTKIKLNN